MPQILSTEGIVLHSIKYSDTSIIARIYTRELGLQSYLVPGVRKKKTSVKNSLFQPLSIFEMVVYNNNKHELQRIKEISSLKQYNHIPSDMKKTSIAMFLSEILVNCLKEQESNPKLFEFLKQSFLFLDDTKEKVADFHLLFLMQLTWHLGFYPNLKHNINKPVFNLREGIYQHPSSTSPYNLDKQSSKFFEKLCRLNYEDLNDLSMPPHLRKTLLATIIDYYKLHMEGFKDIKSLSVLETVFE